MYEIRNGSQKTRRHSHLDQAVAEVRAEYPTCFIAPENSRGYSYVWPSRDTFEARTEESDGSVCQIVRDLC